MFEIEKEVIIKKYEPTVIVEKPFGELTPEECISMLDSEHLTQSDSIMLETWIKLMHDKWHEDYPELYI